MLLVKSFTSEFEIFSNFHYIWIKKVKDRRHIKFVHRFPFSPL